MYKDFFFFLGESQKNCGPLPHLHPTQTVVFLLLAGEARGAWAQALNRASTLPDNEVVAKT